MKALFVRRNKRGGFTFSQLGFAILLLFAVAIVMWIGGKNLFAASRDIPSITECVSIAGRQGRCVPEAYNCVEGVRGLCKDKKKPICCFDKRAYTFEEAKSIFKSEFHGLLNGCRDNPAVCDDATESLRSIMLYTETGDEGKVFIMIKRSGEKLTNFQLLKRQGWFSFKAGLPDPDKSFDFQGDTCILESGEKDDEIKTEKKGEDFTYCIGREKEGVLVGDCKDIEQGKVSIKGHFISIRHQVEDDPSTPVCILYG